MQGYYCPWIWFCSESGCLLNVKCVKQEEHESDHRDIHFNRLAQLLSMPMGVDFQRQTYFSNGHSDCIGSVLLKINVIYRRTIDIIQFICMYLTPLFKIKCIVEGGDEGINLM